MVARYPAASGKLATQQNPIVRLQGDGIDRAVGPDSSVEGRVERAVGVEPDNAVLNRAIEVGEEPAHEDAAVELKREGADGIAGAGAGIIETEVRGTVSIEPGDMVVRHAV